LSQPQELEDRPAPPPAAAVQVASLPFSTLHAASKPNGNGAQGVGYTKQDVELLRKLVRSFGQLRCKVSEKGAVKAYLKTALDQGLDAEVGLPARAIVVATSNDASWIGERFSMRRTLREMDDWIASQGSLTCSRPTERSEANYQRRRRGHVKRARQEGGPLTFSGLLGPAHAASTQAGTTTDHAEQAVAIVLLGENFKTGRKT